MIAFLLIVSSDYIFIHRTELKTTIIKQLSKYTTGKNYGIFSISAILSFLWYMKGVPLFEIHTYEQILLFGELIPS